MNKLVTAVEHTENAKLGGMSTTYASIASCPSSCPLLKAKACYGMSGPVNYVWQRLGEEGRPLEIAKLEAAAIDGLSGNLDLRIHTLGDCKTDATANLVSQAAERYMRRGRRKAFTFTHGWRKVARQSWGKVSVVASCETPSDVLAAKAAGYATALVLPEFEKDVAYMHQGVKIVPCPEQTGRCKTCSQCRLCLQDEKLKAAGITIGFKAHGPSLRAKAMLASKNE